MESVNTPTGDDALKTAKRLIKETIPKRKKIITASILCMVGVSVFTAALAYTTKLIVNDVFVAKDAEQRLSRIIVIFVSFSKAAYFTTVMLFFKRFLIDPFPVFIKKKLFKKRSEEK